MGPNAFDTSTYFVALKKKSFSAICANYHDRLHVLAFKIEVNTAA